MPIRCPPRIISLLRDEGDIENAQPLLFYARYEDRRSGLFIVWGQPHWFHLDVPEMSSVDPKEVLDLLNAAHAASCSWESKRPTFYRCEITEGMSPFWKFSRTKKNLFKVYTHNPWAIRTLGNYLPEGWLPYNTEPDAALKFMIEHQYTTFQWMKLRSPEDGSSDFQDERFLVDQVVHLWRDCPFVPDPEVKIPCRLLVMSCDIEVRTDGDFPMATRPENPICSIAVMIAEGGGERLEATRSVILHTIQSLGGDSSLEQALDRGPSVPKDQGIVSTEWLDKGVGDQFYDGLIAEQVAEIREGDRVYRVNNEHRIQALQTKHAKERRWMFDRLRHTSVVCCQNEEDLLLSFLRLIHFYMPDLFETYHGAFDIGYMFARAEFLGCGEQFRGWSIDTQKKCAMVEKTFQSAAQGTIKYAAIDGIDFISLLDVWKLLRTQKKMSSYKLGHVATEVLAITKADADVGKSAAILEGQDRAAQVGFLVYNLIDAVITFRLAAVLQIPELQVQFSSLAAVGLAKIIDAGQQAKVTPLFQSRALQRNYYIPPKAQRSKEGGYQGATVLAPKVGFYTQWVATLDFNSLYPSIMIAGNYGCDTDAAEEAAEMEEKDLVRAPNGAVFVQPHVQVSIVSSVCTELTKRRAEYVELKKVAENEGNNELAEVYNVAQLAMKLANNSTYGSLGFFGSLIFNKMAAAAVTASGRLAIEKTKGIVNTCTSLPGYAAWCKADFGAFCPEDVTDDSFAEVQRDVIYGDTDSVMILFTKLPTWVPKDQEKQYLFGMLRVLAGFVTDHFTKPMKIVPEKIARTFLMLNKKRYCALIHKKATDPGEILIAGIQVIRRDTCPLFRRVMQTAIHQIFVQQDVTGAIKYIQEMLGKLFKPGATPLSEFLLSKELKRECKWTVDAAQSDVVRQFIRKDMSNPSLKLLIEEILPPLIYRPVASSPPTDPELEGIAGWVGTRPSRADFLKRAQSPNSYAVSYPRQQKDVELTDVRITVLTGPEEVSSFILHLDPGYASQQAHANAVRRYRKDNPNVPSMLGTRVSYAIVSIYGEKSLNKNAQPKLHQKTYLEQVIKANPAKYPIDTMRYFEAFFKNPLSEILDTISGKPGGFMKMFEVFRATGLWSDEAHAGIKRFFSRVSPASAAASAAATSESVDPFQLPVPYVEMEMDPTLEDDETPVCNV